MAIHTIPIREALYERLATLATRRGKKVEDVADEILTETLEKTAAPPHSGMTFAEIFAPVQEDFDASGMTDEELSEFVEAEVKTYRAERRGSEPQQQPVVDG